MVKAITFKDIRPYISVIDRISICNKKTLNYTNYRSITDVGDEYDEMYLYGIGNINSEFETENGTIANAHCIEIMLSDKEKK